MVSSNQGLIVERAGVIYEFFDHAADVGMRCRAASVEELFQAAARAMMEWAGPEPAVQQTVSLQVTLEADDLEGMLVRWLQELLYLFHQRRLYYIAAGRLDIKPPVLRGELLFKPWDESSGTEYQEIKAVTYHQLRVHTEGGFWYASVILDI